MTDQILDNQVEITPEPPKEVELNEHEQQASENGWVPKDQWKGADDEWVPAKQFLKRGQLEAELKRQRQEVTQKEKVIKSMKDYYLNVKEDAKKEVLDTLKKTQRQAIQAEDYAEATKIGLQIDELQDNLDRKFTQHQKKLEETAQSAPTPPPEFYEWNSKNKWYTLGGKDEMTAEADEMAVAYARRHQDASYTDMLNYVTTRMQKLYPEKFVTKKEPVEDPVNEPGAVQNRTSNTSKVRLSAAEKEAADAFGLSYEEYAATLKEYDAKKGRV